MSGIIDSEGQRRAEKLMEKNDLHVRPCFDQLGLWDFDELVDWLWGSPIYRALPERVAGQVAGMVASAIVVGVEEDRHRRG